SDENQSPDGMIFKSFPKEIPTIYMCINALRLIARIFPGHQWGGLGSQRECGEAVVVGGANFCVAAQEADEVDFVLIHDRVSVC
ncbi:MAG: hypothetical protein ACYCOR_21285, partial [Acidobacteriaceae bacterium]